MTVTVIDENNVKTGKQRKNEEVGGGWFVFRRNRKTGRICPGGFPFEHPNRAAAVQEAIRLASANPGETFDILNAAVSIKESVDVPATEPVSEADCLLTMTG